MGTQSNLVTCWFSRPRADPDPPAAPLVAPQLSLISVCCTEVLS